MGIKGVYELVLVIYGLSVIAYFFDFMQHNHKVKRIAFWLLCFVWGSQTFFLLWGVWVDGIFPVFTIQDSLLFYAWVIISFSIIIDKFFPIPFIVFFMNVFGFFILVLYMAAKAQQAIIARGIDLVNELLVSHVVLAIVSYGFFTLAFCLSLMYVIQYQLLKRKKGLQWLRRFNNLQLLDVYAYRFITVGVPLLLISIILGFVWADVSNAVLFWFDLKIIGSLVVLSVYILVLMIRWFIGYQGRNMSLYNMVAFLILLINFFLLSTWSNIHFG